MWLWNISILQSSGVARHLITKQTTKDWRLMMKKLLSLLCGMVMIGSALADLYIPTADFNGYDTNGFPIHGNFGEQGLMRNVGAIEGIDIHDDGPLDPGAYPAYRPETGVSL